MSYYYGYGYAGHDRDGRMTSRNADMLLSYDAKDQLTDVARLDSTYTWKYVHYRHDASGRRTTRTQDGVAGVTSYVYEDHALLPIAEYQNSTLVWRFVYGSKPNVPDFAIKDGTVYRIFSDHLGSPRLVVNTTSGAIVQRMDYDEWGNVTEWIQSGFSPIPFGFAGGLYDRVTGLVHFGARDYDPLLHRWITKDRAGFEGGATNFYGYANNDPVNYADLDCAAAVRAPGFAESLIPVWGPTRQALHDAQCGNVLGAAFNTALAASDLFGVGEAYRGIKAGAFFTGRTITRGPRRGTIDFGSDAARAWYRETRGITGNGTQVHHWLIEDNSRVGKWLGANGLDWVKNQPWNFVALDELIHQGGMHGNRKYFPEFGPIGKLVFGTPNWAKTTALSSAGRAAMGGCGCE